MPERPVSTRPERGRSVRWWRRLAVFAVASTCLVWTGSAERQSLERANRLHRGGRSEDAARIYQARAPEGDREIAAAVGYNLGTALIELGRPSGEEQLSRADGSQSEEIRARAIYNVGLSRLNRALDVDAGDSTRAHAEASVVANRRALRMRPSDLDVKWNLAMGLRLLDSIDAAARRSGREMADGEANADVVVRSVNIPDAAEDEFAEDPPAEGEDEALASAGDESPLSAEEAQAILGVTHLDATSILTKLLALEGRSRWGRPRTRTPRR